MKYYKYICLLLLVSICYSCQNEDELVNETFLTKTKAKEFNESSRTVEPTLEEYRVQLQWVSFLTAHALSNNSKAEQFFINVANSTLDTAEPNVIKMRDLVANDGIENRFEKAFKEAFYYYFFNNSTCPSDGRAPRGGPKPPGVGGGGCQESSCTENLYREYVNFISRDNCLELFLPNGYNPFINLIHTTAHPLNNLATNQGYFMPEDCDSILIISPFNVHSLDNVIIARPYRDESAGCTYTELDFIPDFTTFLNF